MPMPCFIGFISGYAGRCGRGGELCRCIVALNRCSWPSHANRIRWMQKAGKHNGSGGHSAKTADQMEDEAGLYITSYDGARTNGCPTQRGSGGCDIRLCQSAWYATGRSRCNGKTGIGNVEENISYGLHFDTRFGCWNVGDSHRFRTIVGCTGCQDSGKVRPPSTDKGNLNISATDRCGIGSIDRPTDCLYRTCLPGNRRIG